MQSKHILLQWQKARKIRKYLTTSLELEHLTKVCIFVRYESIYDYEKNIHIIISGSNKLLFSIQEFYSIITCTPTISLCRFNFASSAPCSASILYVDAHFLWHCQMVLHNIDSVSISFMRTVVWLFLALLFINFAYLCLCQKNGSTGANNKNNTTIGSIWPRRRRTKQNCGLQKYILSATSSHIVCH